MTTVLIGRGQAQLPDAERPAQLPDKAEQSPEKSPQVRQFTSPVRVKRRLPLRPVFFAQLLIAAAAGAFVYLGGVWGTEELRSAIAEAVRGALNG